MTYLTHYPVMIKGKWGAGKTSFMKRSTDNLRNNSGHALYVSLYGISDTRGIEEELYRQLHPILANKNMVLAGRIAKAVLKGTLRIDIDRDGKDDGAASVAIPDIDLPEYLRNVGGNVLVFDDIERCAIPIVELLGYINYFVEHGGHKVVLVVNEDEIIKSSTSNDESTNQNANKNVGYDRIKEKLVGKTFEIESDVEEAVNVFVDELGYGNGRTVVEKNKQLICELFKVSTYQNLRHLRQAILEFDRLIDSISAEFHQSELLIKDLLSSLLAVLCSSRTKLYAK
ncbi:MAG: P-loop NTPase fold protein [Methylococcales bacterium]|nr:P-loop NTPase fold protein [Methylococcales bacterium]